MRLVSAGLAHPPIGGGFVMSEQELAAGKATDAGAPVPYAFHSAREMLEMAARSGKSPAVVNPLPR